MRKTALFLCLAMVCSFVLQGQQPYRITARKVFDVRDAVTEGSLSDGDRLGSSFATLGSFPGLPAGTLIASGLRGADGPGGSLENAGLTWLLNIRPNGKIQKVNTIGPADIPELAAFNSFGDAMANVGDLDGDGLPELAIGAPFSDVAGETEVGALYICYLNADGSLRRYSKISNNSGGLPPALIPALSRFGSAVAPVGDLDGNGVTDIAVSAPYDNVAGTYSGGAFYLLFLDSLGQAINYRVINPTEPLLNGRIVNGDFFGSGMAWLGSFGGPGTGVLAVGAWGADASGRVHLLSFTSTGIVNRNVEITTDLPLLAGVIDSGDAFGFSLAALGDLNGDGITELAVSAPGDDESNDGVSDKGAVYILYLQADAIPLLFDKVSETSGGLNVDIAPSDFFAVAVGAPGDIDGDGIPDLIIGARNKAVDGLRTGNFFLTRQLYCRKAANPVATIGGPTNLELNWDDQPRAKGYLVQTRVTGTTEWTNLISSSNVLTVDTLEPGETYDWRIVTGCGSGTSSFNSETLTIYMPLFRNAGVTPRSNPVEGVLVVDVEGSTQPGSGLLSIWSADGRLMHRERLEQSSGANAVIIQESLNWPEGLYWMEWKTPSSSFRASPFQLLR